MPPRLLYALRLLSGLWLAALALPARADATAVPALPPALVTHLEAEVPYWLNEPRLFVLLRDSNTKNANLDPAALATLEQRWQQELDAGGGELGDRVASRFASKYFAEVALRMGVAYGNILALDRRGLLAAASELPGHYVYEDEPALQALAADPSLPWAVAAAEGTRYTRVLLPIVDPDDNSRVGTLILEVDTAKLARLGTMRDVGHARRLQAPQK